jgi:anti-anti-sigma factor
VKRIFQVRISTQTLDGIVIVSVSGAVDSYATGQLNDALVQCICEGAKKLIVDLSGVHLMTRAGVRGLIVASKLMDTAQGEMRICNAMRSVETFLQSSGFNYLLNRYPSLQLCLADLRGGESRDAECSAEAAPSRAAAPTEIPTRYSI